MRELRSVAERLEQGQASTPLTSEADSLLQTPDKRPSSITLILTTVGEERPGSVLGWLAGLSHQAVQLKLFESPDLVEIRLGQHGFALQSNAGGLQTFESLEQFIDATRDSSRLSAGMLDHLKLQASQLDGENLTVIVGPLDQPSSEISLILARSVREPTVLVIAGSGEHSLSESEKQMIGTVSGLVGAVLPVVVGPAPASPLGWWSRLPGPAPALPVAFTGASMDEPRPPFLAEEDDSGFRGLLREAANARRTVALADMIDERLAADVRALQARQRREMRLEKAQDPGRDSEDRVVIERIKAQISDDLSKLTQALRERARKAGLKTGEMWMLIDGLLASIGQRDLEREVGHKTIRLTLRRQVVDELRGRLAKALRKQVAEDCILVRDALEVMRRDAELALTDMNASNRSLPVTPPDVNQAWAPIEEALHLDIRYRGEVPKRGFLQRLGEGRRVVFVVLMITSLFGSFLGFNIRQAGAIGVLFLLIFIGTVVYTHFSWKKEDEAGYEDELQKLRDTLTSDFGRLLSDALKERQTRLQLYVDEVKRDLFLRLDRIHRDAQMARLSAAEAERQSAKAKLKLLEQRLRELQPLAQQISRARMNVEKRLSEAQSAVAGAVRGRPDGVLDRAVGAGSPGS